MGHLSVLSLVGGIDHSFRYDHGAIVMQYSFENFNWKYDIDSYERGKRIINLFTRINPNHPSLEFWKKRVNDIVAKYPSAKLEKV